MSQLHSNRNLSLLPAGNTLKLNVNFSKSTGLDIKRIPVYGEYINIKVSNGDVPKLLYSGIAFEPHGCLSHILCCE